MPETGQKLHNSFTFNPLRDGRFYEATNSELDFRPCRRAIWLVKPIHVFFYKTLKRDAT